MVYIDSEGKKHYSDTKTINIRLDHTLLEYLDHEIDYGPFASRSDAVRKMIRKYRAAKEIF